jgi:hypothetical protein
LENGKTQKKPLKIQKGVVNVENKIKNDYTNKVNEFLKIQNEILSEIQKRKNKTIKNDLENKFKQNFNEYKNNIQDNNLIDEIRVDNESFIIVNKDKDLYRGYFIEFKHKFNVPYYWLNFKGEIIKFIDIDRILKRYNNDSLKEIIKEIDKIQKTFDNDKKFLNDNENIEYHYLLAKSFDDTFDSIDGAIQEYQTVAKKIK